MTSGEKIGWMGVAFGVACIWFMLWVWDQLKDFI